MQRFESGHQNLTLVSLERIAKALKIEPETLLSPLSPALVKSSPASIVEALARAGYATRVATESGRRPSSSVPIVNLRAAAGKLRSARAIDVLGWVTFDRPRRVADGMFVARIEGDSMEPGIPNGAFALFRPSRQPAARGKIYLFEHATLEDADFGGPYVVKRMGAERKLANGKTRVALESDNTRYAPIVLYLDDTNELRVVAELVELLA